MHADDTNYTVVKNGVVVVSGTGPAIRIDGNRLLIRDGPQETPPLRLTRAEASRRLRHIVVCGHAGGFVTFDALRWLRDTGVAFSQLDWDGAVIIASGPRGPDQPALRRAQALVCSGVMPTAAVAIAREILRVKLRGQADVARFMGSTDASAAIGSLAEAIAGETDGRKALSVEARAALIYWKLWENVQVRFARRNPQRLGPNGRWRPGRPDSWLTFGPRTSLLTGKPFRATTPGNALLNYLYAVLEAEMIVALLAVGLDPGIGMFHVDVDGRSSLALDAIEAVRPYVDYWLLAYLGCSVFANRDFAELPDGEVRLTHPLNSHLAHTAALWRKACEPVAGWLAQSFNGASGLAEMSAYAQPLSNVTVEFPPPAGPLSRAKPASQHATRPVLPPLAAPLPAFMSPARGHRPSAVSGVRLRGGLRDDPVPRMCWECGRALPAPRRAFCSDECAENYRWAMGTRRPIVAATTRGSYDRHREATLAGQRAAHTLPAPDRDALRSWYQKELQPRLSKMSASEIVQGAAMGRTYAYHVIAGTRIPHPRHYPNLAALAGLELPRKFAAALSSASA
jgi:CRISPR-associated endonuclease Cas1